MKKKKQLWRIEYAIVVMRKCGHETKEPIDVEIGRLQSLTQLACPDCNIASIIKPRGKR